MPGKFGAGQGGWPTVRYFNTATGYDGAPYQKKTSKSMCDELGDMTYMRAYVQASHLVAMLPMSPLPGKSRCFGHTFIGSRCFVLTLMGVTGSSEHSHVLVVGTGQVHRAGGEVLDHLVREVCSGASDAAFSFLPRFPRCNCSTRVHPPSTTPCSVDLSWVSSMVDSSALLSARPRVFVFVRTRTSPLSRRG